MPFRLYPGFDCYELENGSLFYAGLLPKEQVFDQAKFNLFWGLHPLKFDQIKFMGKPTDLPRWHQPYVMDYRFPGKQSAVKPLPVELASLMEWVQNVIAPTLNGALATWYDGQLDHYIGKHRDKTPQLIPGEPIVTVSFGEDRIYRLRPWKRAGAHRDFVITHGSVYILPWETNLAWTHEVLPSPKYRGRRISITFRAFAGSSSVGRRGS